MKEHFEEESLKSNLSNLSSYYSRIGEQEMKPNIQHDYDFASPNMEVHKQGHHNDFGLGEYFNSLDHKGKDLCVLSELQKTKSKHTKCYKLNCYQLTSMEFEKSGQEVI